MELPDKGTEDETERDDFLSYAGEWHALVYGFGVGLTGIWWLSLGFLMYSLGKGRGVMFAETSHLRDAVREPAYAIAGLTIGLAGHIILSNWAALMMTPA